MDDIIDARCAAARRDATDPNVLTLLRFPSRRRRGGGGHERWWDVYFVLLDWLKSRVVLVLRRSPRRTVRQCF